jgi:hypothetical protein
MEETPIMLPPWGDCWERRVAAAWMVLNAPDRLVVRVWDQRVGVMLLFHFC